MPKHRPNPSNLTSMETDMVRWWYGPMRSHGQLCPKRAKFINLLKVNAEDSLIQVITTFLSCKEATINCGLRIQFANSGSGVGSSCGQRTWLRLCCAYLAFFLGESELATSGVLVRSLRALKILLERWQRKDVSKIVMTLSIGVVHMYPRQLCLRVSWWHTLLGLDLSRPRPTDYNPRPQVSTFHCSWVWQVVFIVNTYTRTTLLVQYMTHIYITCISHFNNCDKLQCQPTSRTPMCRLSCSSH